jgi:hypothetical protein
MYITVEISAGLIISHPTGVLWTNQTGGILCHHPVIEGFCVPGWMNGKEGPIRKINDIIYARAMSNWRWPLYPSGYPDVGLDWQAADAIDAALAEFNVPYLTIRRCDLAVSEEAWLHLALDSSHEDLRAWDLQDAEVFHAVLTYLNSD